MTRLVILLLLFEIINVKTTRVVNSTKLIQGLQLILDKINNFDLFDKEEFVDNEIYNDLDWEKLEDLRFLTDEQVVELNKAIQNDDGEDDIPSDYVIDDDYSLLTVDPLETDSRNGQHQRREDPMYDYIQDDKRNTHTPSLHMSYPNTLFSVSHKPDVDPIKATKKRPRILNDSTISEKFKYQVNEHRISVLQNGQCLVPQPRWLRVRQLAPAGNMVYNPTCVMLHRCAEDSGCCHDERMVCGPTEGHYVTMPFSISTVKVQNAAARMEFYNHTRCGCLKRDMMPQRAVERDQAQEVAQSRGTEAPITEFSSTNSMDDIENDEQSTEAPRRSCICPTFFRAIMTDTGCKCSCEWKIIYAHSRRRVCHYLAQGLEHFGMRERQCIDEGVCSPPDCEYGLYDKIRGKCPGKMEAAEREHMMRAQERQHSN